MTIPLHPPASWFEHPGNIPTDRRITIQPDGRVYGYVKLRGSCHAGMPGCVDAPDDSPSDFGFAHQGRTMTAEGKEVATAIIAGGSKRHANLSDDIVRAAAHYQEGVEHQLMRVRYGSDRNGIWFSGALWPDANPLDVEHIRASPNSGDWRFVNYSRGGRGAHDFAGSVLVNIPGYAMDNAGVARTADGMMQAIAASGSQMMSHDGASAELDQAGNLHIYTPAESKTEENPSMCQSQSGCACAAQQTFQIPATAVGAHTHQVATVTAAATPCTCQEQKASCDCGQASEQSERVQALIASASTEDETVSFEDAVSLKLTEAFDRLAAQGELIQTLVAKNAAADLML